MMKLSLPTYSSALDLPKTIRQQTGIDCQLDPALRSFSLKLDNSTWSSHSCNVRAGLSLSVLEADFQQHFYLAAESQNCSILRFTFCLSGSLKIAYQSSANDISITAGHSYLSALSGQIQLSSKFTAEKKLLLIRIDIDPFVFQGLIGSRVNALCAKMIDVLMNGQPGYCWQSSPMLPAVKVILYQLLSCPYQDTVRQLYLESKVLELIALQTNQLTERTRPITPSPHLKPDDIERIHHAKHILVNNLRNPPSLASLAKQVSINDFKLKHGFRQVFGTTAFGYLHQYRMEQAQLLLRERELNVTQVSQAVGYANPSQFSAAFKKKFGVTPKTFQSS